VQGLLINTPTKYQQQHRKKHNNKEKSQLAQREKLRNLKQLSAESSRILNTPLQKPENTGAAAMQSKYRVLCLLQSPYSHINIEINGT
jgi:hypothetical protein